MVKKAKKNRMKTNHKMLERSMAKMKTKSQRKK